MPELGKAVYTLILNSAQFDKGLVASEARATAATNAIASGMGRASAATTAYGSSTQAASAQVSAAAKGLSGTVAAATAAASASYGKMAVAAEASAATQVASAAVAAGAWKRVGVTMAALGAKSSRMLGYGALAAGYLVVKSGIEDIKNTDIAVKQLEAGIASTGRVAGVSKEHITALSKKWQELGGVEDEVTMAGAAVLLSFTNIRNGVGASNQIFDRAIEGAQNLSRRFGGDLRGAIVLVGKALNDPNRGLLALTRRGVQFSAQQKETIKQLLATGQGLKAQKLILDVLDRKVHGAAEAYRRSFAGALHTAKAELGDNAAMIINSLIPAFSIFIGGLAKIIELTAKHTTVLKTILGIYIAYKVVTIAAYAALKLNVIWTGILTIKKWIFISAETAATAATGANTAATVANTGALGSNAGATALAGGGFTKFSRILGKAGFYGVVIAASAGLATLAINALGIDGPLKQAGSWVYDLGAKFGFLTESISAASQAAAQSMNDPAIQKKLAGAYNKLAAQGIGKAPKSLRDAMIEKTVGKGYTWNDAMVFAGKAGGTGEAGAASGGAADPGEDMKTPGKPGKTAAQLKSDAKQKAQERAQLLAQQEAARWDISMTLADRAGEASLSRWYQKRRAYLVRMMSTKERMSITLRAQYEQEITQIDKTEAENAKQAAEAAAAKAQEDADATWAIRATLAERGGPKMQLSFLRMRRAFLAREVATHRDDLQLVSQNQQEITQIDSEIASKIKEEQDKRNAIGMALTAKQRIAFTKAERTTGVKDDMKFWRSRLTQLKDMLRSTKRNSERAADIEEQITDVYTKLKEAKEKQNDKRLNSLKEIQSAMDLRGTFFGRFASSVFGKDSAGKLTMGAQGTASNSKGTPTSPRGPRRFAQGGEVPSASPVRGIHKKNGRWFLQMYGGDVAVPYHKNIDSFVERYKGHGLSPAKANDVLGFWKLYGPQIISNSRKFGAGGRVPGSGRTDTVPALLTPGELVLTDKHQASLARMLGLSDSGQILGELARNTTGGTTKTMNYTQNNSYQEIPRDRFAHARQMRQATSGAWD